VATFLRSDIRVQSRAILWGFTGLLLFGLVILLFVQEESLRIVLTDLLTPIIGLCASGVLFYTYWKTRSVATKLALAFLFMALGCLAWALGDVAWAVLEIVLKEEPFPSIADIFYLAYYPLIIVGFLLIPYERSSRRDRIKNWLDLSIVFLAAGMLYWNFLIGPTAVFEGIDWLTAIISLAYPVFDYVLFAGLMVFLYRNQRLLSLPAILCIAASILIQIVADTIYGLQSIAGTYVSGTILDFAWQVGFATFGVAGILELQALHQMDQGYFSKNESGLRQKLNTWLTFTPYLWLSIAYLLLIYAEFNILPMHYQIIVIGIGIMIALVIARQVISISETTRLSEQLTLELIERQRAQELLRKSNDELEDRVRQRTMALTEANQRFKNEIAERRRAEQRLEYSLHEKEILLKEIHHRVKNNLQVISSMLNLQANQTKDSSLIAPLMDSRNRVQSMALIHEKLYCSSDLSNIDFSGYLESLVSSLYNSINSNHKDIKIRVISEPIAMEIDSAMPCGLIINELISNALKHAFPDRNSGDVIIQLKTNGDNQVQLIVSDNGVGFPENFDIQNSPSLGLQLVNALVNQLDGDLKYDTKQGTQFTLTISNTIPV
jgi:two-component sensor histidine kinase